MKTYTKFLAMGFLKSFFKERNASPIWSSHRKEKKIKLPSLDLGKSMQRFDTKLIDEQDKNGLSFSVQYTLSSYNQIYIKLLISNENEFEIKKDQDDRLNKKDDANKLSFFSLKKVSI